MSQYAWIPTGVTLSISHGTLYHYHLFHCGLIHRSRVSDYPPLQLLWPIMAVVINISMCLCFQNMINAHKDWICGLAFMPGGNCLLSGCRGGYLKLWHIDNCTPLGEIQAHKSPINAICTNNSMIFTASK